ncbi:type I restriction enzyme, S subunit [Pseudoalteromonas ulvae UL12]|uniref:restriction endonuclease subunit S n=1 Tax=Pseudoalteromonas ulvae TaxID=107327 RepID=UPI00186BADBB|nr:restriction endonuclease subunit S [Pseudoalteromonas ulvae]MBE0362459.1 type I restriction enzyme, S subunit [Pseudoalteromonas ulvae UL12]
MKVPELRFTKYDEDWLTTTIGDVSRVTSGGTPSRTNSAYWGGHIPWVTTSLIDFGTILHAEEFITDEGLKNSSAKLFPKGTLLIALYGQGVTRGKVSLLGIDATTNQACAAMIFDEEKVLPSFALFQLMSKYEAIRNLANDGGQKNLSGGLVKSLGIALPKIEEQQKIADFLSSVDKKISLLKEKHALLAQYKKGVMQKLFKQEIRFKDENSKAFPDWQETSFDKVFERVTRKNKEDNQNVLTISAQRGLINQEKYFNKSVSAKNVTGYYLLEKGEFAYNKSYSKGYPMGAIKRLNNYDKGVVSTLYICFKTHGEQYDEFWEQHFEAGNLNREINKIAQEGARNHGLLNVSVTEFFQDIKVQMPSKKEQERIAEFLGALDAKINAVNEQIELTQTFKKGLLQQMFV